MSTELTYNPERLIWRVFIDDRIVRYECAKCEDWSTEYPYPFVHNQRTAQQVLNRHMKVCEKN